MEDSKQESRTVIGCSADNVAEFRAAVKRWPQLHSLVTGLQEIGAFPGLRAMQFTLTGTPEYVAQGLDAIQAPQTLQAQPEAAQTAQGSH